MSKSWSRLLKNRDGAYCAMHFDIWHRLRICYRTYKRIGMGTLFCANYRNFFLMNFAMASKTGLLLTSFMNTVTPFDVTI